MNRRKFLKIAGTSTVVLAASATVGIAAMSSGPAANMPWHIAGSNYSEPRMRALSWAILAPNPHNRQPWLVKMQDNLSMTISIDTAKVLPETDPFNRQILIGIGGFCELLTLAAAEDGYELVFDWFPQGVADEHHILDKRPIANVQFKQGASLDPLFKQVLKRRSYKEKFTDQPITQPSLEKLKLAQQSGAIINTDNSSVGVEHLRKLTVKAMEIELATERTYHESTRLLRIGTDEVKTQPDGIDLDGRKFMILRLLGLFSHKSAFDMQSSAYHQTVSEITSKLHSTQGYLWISTIDNSRQSQIEAGRNYLRANLKATEIGIKMHPLSQGLQEFAEMNTIFQELHQTLGINNTGRIQMLARLGHGDEIEASPRWPAEKCITV